MASNKLVLCISQPPPIYAQGSVSLNLNFEKLLVILYTNFFNPAAMGIIYFCSKFTQ